MRRLLQPAWDLAFSWLREEPPVHHTAIPWQIAAAISTCLLYGWFFVAGCVAICWGGLARVGEFLAAKRCNLVLFEDAGENFEHVLLAVQEPKTRFRAARHQCLKVDQPQLVQVIRLAFSGFDPTDRLWAASPSTLRSRFKRLLAALKLKPNVIPGIRDMDLGSLRAGGATWLMSVSEDPEMVRRRGRWINTKIMAVYVQEVSSVLLLPKLPDTTKIWIFAWANALQEATRTADESKQLRIQPRMWFSLVS